MAMERDVTDRLGVARRFGVARTFRGCLFTTIMMLGAMSVSLGVAAASAPDAAASVPTSFCQGKSANTVVKVYYRGPEVFPLRCGTATWGFNHITARWNAGFDASIAVTVARAPQTGNAFYEYTCPTFRVIFNQGALNGTGVQPQGIITAYPAPA